MTLAYQCTVSGIDSGGFSWENVFHVSSDYAGSDSTFETAKHLNDFIVTTLATNWTAAMNNQSRILEVSSRCINPNPDFTRIRNYIGVGARATAPAIGAVCGRIVFLPTAANLHISSLFVNNGCEGDFVADQIQGPYQAMLEDLGDSFLLFDGSEATYGWQLIQWHRKTSDAADIDQYYVSANPTTLNKRMRA